MYYFSSFLLLRLCVFLLSLSFFSYLFSPPPHFPLIILALFFFVFSFSFSTSSSSYFARSFLFYSSSSSSYFSPSSYYSHIFPYSSYSSPLLHPLLHNFFVITMTVLLPSLLFPSPIFALLLVWKFMARSKWKLVKQTPFYGIRLKPPDIEPFCQTNQRTPEDGRRTHR